MVNGQRYGANDLNVIGSMRLIVMANDITALYLHRNKCHASSNKCLTSSNKKLLGTSATLLVTSALLVADKKWKLLELSASLLVTRCCLLVVTRSYRRN